MAWYTDDMSNLLTTEVASGVWQLINSDRNALPGHPSIMRVPAPPGSVTVRVPELDFFGVAALAAQTNQEDDPGDTDVADTASDIVLARYSKAHFVSGFMAGRDPTSISKTASQFAVDAFMSYGIAVRSLYANLVDNFATAQTTSGIDLTFETYLAAIASLEVNENVGAILAMLAPIQFADLRADLALNSGGAIQLNQAPQQIINAAKGIGLQGELAGTTIFTTSDVVTSGGNRSGGMFTRGAIIHAVAPPVVDSDFPQMLLGGDVLFEKVRGTANDVTEMVSHAYMGAIEGVDLKGVTITTDA